MSSYHMMTSATYCIVLIAIALVIIAYCCYFYLHGRRRTKPNTLKCFLTVKPNALFYDFVKRLPDVDNVYICIDDNSHDIPNYDGKVKIIKIDDKDCIECGFHSTVLWLQDKACSRDKALYYFYKNNINYDHIWFLEEDVLVPTLRTIENMDIKYPNDDLLVSEHGICRDYRTDWHWKLVNGQLKGKLELPYAHAMICAVRCSRKLLDCVFDFALRYKTLFLDEALFNTIALHNDLEVRVIKELKGIVWRKEGEWQEHEVNANNLYHPVKSIERQYELRAIGKLQKL